MTQLLPVFSEILSPYREGMCLWNEFGSNRVCALPSGHGGSHIFISPLEDDE